MSITKTPAITVVSQRWQRRSFYRTLKEFCRNVVFENGDITITKIKLTGTKAKKTKLEAIEQQIADLIAERDTMQSKMRESCPHPIENITYSQRFVEGDYYNPTATTQEWLECDMCGSRTAEIKKE